ncbi:unnamed protein product [Victoria cruziana]
MQGVFLSLDKKKDTRVKDGEAASTSLRACPMCSQCRYCVSPRFDGCLSKLKESARDLVGDYSMRRCGAIAHSDCNGKEELRCGRRVLSDDLDEVVGGRVHRKAKLKPMRDVVWKNSWGSGRDSVRCGQLF